MSALSSPVLGSKAAQQKITSKYKIATKNLRFALLPPGAWLELSRVINKSAAKVRKLKLEETIKTEDNVVTISTPKSPRSIAEQAFLTPTTSSKQLLEKQSPTKKNESSVDYMNNIHSLCIGGSTSLDMFRM